MSGTTKPIVTRFAPSPTGALHVGGARTALFSWAYARKHGGKFILRFEDTDLARSSEASAQTILADLQWLGIDWDEGPDVGGPNAPYRQSERLDIYNKYIDQLLATEQAYEDDGAVRFRVDDDITIDDAVFGRVEVKAADIEDFIIRKGEAGGKFPTFHFAVVIDDALMGVTHVIRGQEHLSNTPKHAALYDALGFERPTWAHTPSIMNPDGSKMSKRDKAKAARKAAKDAGLDDPAFAAFMNKDNDDGDTAKAIAEQLNLQLPEIDVSDFRASGYLPEVLCNYIALLGWNPGASGGGVEQFDMAYFVENFSLERVGKANSKFDRDKLFRFNADAIKAMAPKKFRKKLSGYTQESPSNMGVNEVAESLWRDPRIGVILDNTYKDFDDERFQWFAEAIQPRCRILKEALTEFAYLLPHAEITYQEDKNSRKALIKNNAQGYQHLVEFQTILQEIPDWEPVSIQEALEAFTTSRQLKNMGIIAQPLRIAVSGGTVTPPINLTLAIIGKQETYGRISDCIGFFGNAARESQQQ